MKEMSEEDKKALDILRRAWGKVSAMENLSEETEEFQKKVFDLLKSYGIIKP